MNLIAIGSAGFLAVVLIALLLFKRLALKPLWSSANAKRKAIEELRKTQILKG